MRRKTHRVRLGPWPIVGTDEARQECLNSLRRLWNGEPPHKPLIAEVAGSMVQGCPTLTTTLAEYLASRKLSCSATADLRSVIHKHAAEWADKPIGSLDARSIATRYRVVAAESLASANRLLGALSALTKYAHAAHGVGDSGIIKRARALLGTTDSVAARNVVITDDLQATWAGAVAVEAPGVSRYLRALMLSGLRANELRRLTPTDWGSATGVLRLKKTKNGKPHALACGPMLRALIDEEAAHLPATAPLFNVPVKVYRAAVARIGAAVEIAWHLHDLRRTFATVARRAGVDADMLKRLMNHSAGTDVTAKHYVRLDVEDLRPAMVIIESSIASLWQVGGAAKPKSTSKRPARGRVMPTPARDSRLLGDAA